MRIEYPGYLFKDLQPKTAPYHLLLKYLTDYPPEGYTFEEKPDNIQESQIHKYVPIQNFLEEWAAKTGVYDVNEVLDHTIKNKAYRTDPFPYELPLDKPCLMSPFPIITPNPYMLEIEDWVTLFCWYFFNGLTSHIDVKCHHGTRILKALFSLDNCRGIFTHIPQTIESLTSIFGKDLQHKFRYIPIGYEQPKGVKPKKVGDTINFLFHGSFNHTPLHFFLRGGFAFLEAFLRQADKYKNITYTIIYDEIGMSMMPYPYYRLIKTHTQIRYINRYLPKNEFEAELRKADVFVIPAHRTHSMSISQALSWGIPVLTSNGWGIDHYVKDGYNGLVAKFSPQVNSWVDDTGIFREEYQPIHTLNETLVSNLEASIEGFVEQPYIIENMSESALEFAKENLSIENRNKYLKPLLDEAFHDYR